MKEIKLKYKKYPKYKDSGVEWLGEIPEGWSIKPGLSFISEVKEKNTGMKRTTVLSLSYGNIRVKKNDELTGLVPESFETYQLVEKGDLIFRPTDLQNDHISLRSAISDYIGIITSAYLNLRFNKNIHPKFYHYFFRAIDNNKVIYGLGSGLRQNIDYRDFRRFNFASPPLPEQTAIAIFLDEKTANIDKAIANKQKLIDLLKERKQIIIQNAVTGQLKMDNGQWIMRPKSEMKDSGVEWIGAIPEHWEVKKLFGLCSFVRGNSSFSKDELLSNGEYVALQYGKSYKVNEVDENYKFYVNSEFYKDSQIINYGDIIFISTSETIEDLGHSVYYKRSDLGLLGGEQILLKPKIAMVNSNYLFYSSKVFSKELRKYATGIKVFRFNINDLKTIYIPLPKKNEQKQIVAYIESQSTKIDKAITLQQKQIEKLKEYKTVLIDSAVTGGIKVN